jgi:NAD(P)-dependent dehydrogenase (short-subunit alcohol dehydrogenase family)
MTDIKVALITGAGSGMGQVAAKRLVARGVKVVGIDLNEQGLEATRDGRPNFFPVVCDVTDEDAVERVVAETWEKRGPIDRFVHCAAIMPSAVLIEHDPKVVKKLMRINYEGTVNVAYSILPRMAKAGGGQAVFFGSVAGYVLSPHFGAYCASKAAVNAFVECLIRENKDPNTKILLVCPPQVNTPLLEQTTSKPKTLELAKEQGMLRTPDFIIDQLEAALDKGKSFLFPGIETKIMYATRRLAPNLLWNVIQRAEDGKPLFTW